MEVDKYKIVNGTSYRQNTLEEVINILENAIKNKTCIRIFYGNPKTGEDNMEIYNTLGIIVCSGQNKVPLLRSGTGEDNEIFDDCIVKITIDKETVYQHPNYHLPEIEIREANGEYKKSGFLYSVFVKGGNRYNCKSREEAEKEVKFYKGLSNTAD